ncbi:MAG: CDP-alcohol phosphatidyltransferase family protein [Saprospiraceae bacterium]|nr:CDP-alcohol phosphatidyltransferase family protein [Saprospiraceae bacterium]
MTKHLPNAITLFNLFCGCCAIVSILGGDILTAVGWLAAAAVADFADGAVARALHVQSPIGIQLDSLADMVSFGVAPGAMLFMLLNQAFMPEGPAWQAFPGQAVVFEAPPWQAFPGFVLSVFSGLRLAKFNIDTRQTKHFLGLATPACTILVAGLALVVHFDSFGLGGILLQPWLLYVMIALLSGLLVSEIPMFSLKISGLRWKGNEIKFIFAAVSLLLVFVLGWAAPAAVILLYLLVNLIIYFTSGKTST